MALVAWSAGTAAAQPLRRTDVDTTWHGATLPFTRPHNARAPRQSDDGPSSPPSRSFEALRYRVQAGDEVDVVDLAGVRIRGRLVAISDASLTVKSRGSARTFVEGTVSRVERRRRDTRRNGTLIGLGAGALVGWLAGRGADSPSCPRSGIECGQGVLIGVAGGAVWGAVGGWTVDTLIRARDVLYEAPPISDPPQRD